MTKNPFVGVWRLISFERTGADGRISYPFGKDAVGYIMYTEDGHMSVAFMSPNRPKISSAHSGVAMSEILREKVAAFDTFQSYCGKYETQGAKVIHHVEVSSFPNWVGADLERVFEFDGDRLSLSVPASPATSTKSTIRLVWKREC